MRLNDHRIIDICKYLNERGYKRYNPKSKTHSTYEMTTASLSNLLRNPIYTGYYKYGDREYTNLCEIYDFNPMISSEEFLKITDLANGGKKFKGVGSAIGDITNKIVFLKDKVTCAHCSKRMGITINKGRAGVRYTYFRCNYEDCPYLDNLIDNPKHNRHSVRAKVVSDALINSLINSSLLDGGFSTYKASAEVRLRELSERLQKDIITFTNRITILGKDITSNQETINQLVSMKSDEEIIELYTSTIANDKKRILELENKIESNKKTT